MRKKCSSDREKLLKFEAEGPRICKNFEITRTIYSNSDRSEQFLVTEYFFSNLNYNCSTFLDVRNLQEQVVLPEIVLTFHCLNKLLK